MFVFWVQLVLWHRENLWLLEFLLINFGRKLIRKSSHNYCKSHVYHFVLAVYWLHFWQVVSRSSLLQAAVSVSMHFLPNACRHWNVEVRLTFTSATAILSSIYSPPAETSSSDSPLTANFNSSMIACFRTFKWLRSWLFRCLKVYSDRVLLGEAQCSQFTDHVCMLNYHLCHKFWVSLAGFRSNLNHCCIPLKVLRVPNLPPQVSTISHSSILNLLFLLWSQSKSHHTRTEVHNVRSTCSYWDTGYSLSTLYSLAALFLSLCNILKKVLKR